MWIAFIDKLAGAKRSLTIWFNGAIGTAVLIIPNLNLKEQIEQIKEYIPLNYFKWAIVAIVAVNVLLRFKTTQPLENK